MGDGDATTDGDILLPEAFEPRWSLVVLPDTQVYSAHHAEIFREQVRWIAEEARNRNIRYVLHVGDVTEWNADWEWQNASDAMAQLDGIVPYAIVPGNHDYDPDRVRDSDISNYFSPERFRDNGGLERAFEDGKSDNTYHLFEADGEAWSVLALEWGPRDNVLAWANNVLDSFPNRKAIVLTHAYLYTDDTRYDWARRGDEQKYNPHRYPAERWPQVNDGQELWNKLIIGQPNIRFVFSGHVPGKGVGRRLSHRKSGPAVHEMVSNYQSYERGGNGYLRFIEFGECFGRVRTYSPYLGSYMPGPEHQFAFRTCVQTWTTCATSDVTPSTKAQLAVFDLWNRTANFRAGRSAPFQRRCPGNSWTLRSFGSCRLICTRRHRPRVRSN